jgi:hypothetical protein
MKKNEKDDFVLGKASILEQMTVGFEEYHLRRINSLVDIFTKYKRTVDDYGEQIFKPILGRRV